MKLGWTSNRLAQIQREQLRGDVRHVLLLGQGTAPYNPWWSLCCVSAV
jgi:hypothetical protein